MNKLYSVLAGGLLSMLALGALPAAGQTQPHPVRCSTEDVNAQIQAELKRTIPGYDPDRKASPARTLPTGRTGAVTYTLPVIVHVINNGERIGLGSNISQAQVQSQLDVLNEDYRNLNADGSLVPTVYQSRRGDMQVQFVNAVRDPSGNLLTEPGIDRVNRTAKGFTAPPYASTTYINNTIKTNTYWDPSRYINIWVLDLGGGLLGYAQFPDNTAGLGGLSTLGGSAATDGVVVLYGCFGSRAKVPGGNFSYPGVYDRGRTLTHELGHWFGLRHIWGDAACGNDYCADTPTQQTNNYGCVAFPQVTCSNVTGDMSMNYMDYSNDPCMYMFTQNQKDRLQAVMLNTPRRAELVNSNVACTSVVAATAANGGPACAGSSLTLTATGPTGATYAWTGPNGYTSTAQNPTLNNITAAAAGTYKVTVTVASGSACPGVATTNVVVNPTPPVPTITASGSTCSGLPVTLSAAGLTPTGTLPNETFNGTAPGWTIGNTGAPATSWQYTTGTTLTYPGLVTNFSIDGTRFPYAISDAGGAGSTTNTTLTSPAFSTVGYSALSVSFQQAIILDTGTSSVEISTDGGSTWAAVYSNTDDITTVTTTSINLAGYLNQPNVRLRWHYIDAWGYLWVMDNVQFTATIPTLTYSWSLVSGNGLPAITNTSSISVTPTVNSVYRLTIGYAGSSCTSSATVSLTLQSVWTGATGDGNWFTAGNWQGNCVPSRTTDALIPAGLTTPYPTIATGTAEVRNLTQQGSLTMTGGELDLYGDHTGIGALNLSGGIVATRGTSTQALRSATYQTLLGAGTGTKTIPASTVNVALTMSGAILNTGSATVTLGPTATITETDATYVLGQVTTTHLVLNATDNFGGLGVTFTPNTPAGNTTVLRTTGQPLGTGTNRSISRYYDIAPLVNRALQGANLSLSYLPHELNGLTESQLVLFRQTDGSTTWSNEGASSRDVTNKVVTRNYVTSSTGRWTLAASLPTGTVNYAVHAFPVPFTADGLGIEVTTDTAGPLFVKMYDSVGRVIYNNTIDNITPGTSNVMLPGSSMLQAGQYILHITQNGKETRLRVARD